MLYVDGKRRNIQVARIVAHAFVEKPSEEANTVNHKDGDINNNSANNLEWATQSQNNEHKYRVLKQPPTTQKRFHFKYIVYRNEYKFTTIAAFAKFLGMSETQTRRYLEFPEKHEIQLIR